jgi:hypothetical protein
MPYFPPDLPEYNHLRHMCLPCPDAAHPFTEKDILPYIAHINTKGNPDDWMFDSFLPLTSAAPSGNYIYADINRGTTRSGEGDFFALPSPNPARASDWLEFLDSQFCEEGLLTLLEKTITSVASKLGKPEWKRNVVITIPYPHPNQYHFGRITTKEPSLNFSITGQNLMKASEQRLEACLWYIDETLARWKKANFKNLNLLGFYWIYESIHYSWEVDDHWVIKELYKQIKQKKSKLFWIPFYSSFNVNILSVYKDFYFDCAFMQPNHMFYKDIKDVKQAALEAKDRYAGFEMEYCFGDDPRLGRKGERQRRFRNYLNGGVKYGDMTEAACAYYLNSKDAARMAYAKDKIENGLYHDMYHFIKGDYSIK